MIRISVRLAAAWLLGAVAANAAPWHDGPSDIPVDPSIHWGRLDNGLRYAVMPNHEPAGRVSLRLLVAAGSLVEGNNERGIAHFIEHLAFRNTRGFPHRTMLPKLERLGMGLGPDTAAFTTFDYTVYQLELPDPGAASLQLGFDIFREWAGNVVFVPDEVPAELGVVLSEKDARNTPQSRFNGFNLAFLWPDERRVERNPIGLEASLRKFSVRDFQRFYDAWYRPERMAVIVVGDVDPAVAESRLRTAFASFRARGRPGVEPKTPSSARTSPSRTQVWSDPAWAGATIVFEHATPRLLGPPSHEIRVEDMRESLALSILQRRMEHSAHSPGAAYVTPIARLQLNVPGWRVADVTSSVRLSDLARGIVATEQDHRRAFLYGFTAQEVREAKASYAADLQQSVRAAGTRPSPMLASYVESMLLYGGTLATPQATREDIGEDLAATTVTATTDAFRRAWSSSAPHVLIAVNSLVKIPPSAIVGVLTRSRLQEVEPAAEKAPVAFAYAQPGPPGTFVHEDYEADLQAHLNQFANGVRLNFKATPFEANTVEFTVRVGGGRNSAPPLRGIELFANYGLMAGGLGRHSAEEVTTLCSGHEVQIGFQVGSNAGVLYGRCARQELPFALQLVAAYLTDPGFRSEQARDVKGAIQGFLTTTRNSPDGPINRDAFFYLSQGDSRFAPPDDSDIDRRTYAELEAWLKPQLTRGPVEAAVVGDVTWEEVVAAAGRTLGALPARPGPGGPAAPLHFIPGPVNRRLFSGTAVKSCGLEVIWAAPDIRDTPGERRCTMLAAVLAERVRLRLREELGATYSPAVEFSRDGDVPGCAMFRAIVDTDQARLAHAAELIVREAKALGEAPVDPDGFARAREPLLRMRADELRQNSHWLYTVLSEAQQNPSHIADTRTREKDYASIGPADIQAVAKRYFRKDNTYLFSTTPAAH